ncbi:MAG: hypothetical protein DMF74_02180 [Acidobacteria bacterium]|nr:MAG: hypothetical protein DMF74_02180 [Acidobacteriota bacterium]
MPDLLFQFLNLFLLFLDRVDENYVELVAFSFHLADRAVPIDYSRGLRLLRFSWSGLCTAFLPHLSKRKAPANLVTRLK